MTRVVSGSNDSALVGSHVELRVLAALQFASGTVYANDGAGDIVWNGNTYLGIGTLGAVDAVRETVDSVAKQVTLTLSGLEPSLVATARDEVYQNRTATLYLAILDPVAGVVIATPETIWEGRMDTMRLNIDAKAGSIQMTLEHRLRREPRIARYTDADQQLAFSGDTFFNCLNQIPGFVSNWGGGPIRTSGGIIIGKPGQNREV